MGTPRAESNGVSTKIGRQFTEEEIEPVLLHYAHRFVTCPVCGDSNTNLVTYEDGNVFMEWLICESRELSQINNFMVKSPLFKFSKRVIALHN